MKWASSSTGKKMIAGQFVLHAFSDSYYYNYYHYYHYYLP